MEWLKCGESWVSAVPTVLWLLGTAALAHRLLSTLFRGFLFRRVPLWEVILQHLLFVWMVIYSLHFWTLLVNVLKWVVEYSYEHNEEMITAHEYAEIHKAVTQWMIWMCGAAPLCVYWFTRSRPERQPFLIWITTNPWQRREMGPYGYYLNRPLTSLPSTNNLGRRHEAMYLRRAHSDYKILTKELHKNRRHSKSV